ncbi:fimbrial protein [Iodobacter sp. CM08]|uniref:fimbrial protein n=1 Tax=Iodobacter sp. CM08 TaxID=3085902 RepID=UPI002980AE29|nr:fimbrial protein [Iodobacter sp. CM08]MDW5415854.1 fimbrial protein [Iodobacter sp. CM08]
MNGFFRIVFLCIAVTYSAFSFSAINCYSALTTAPVLASDIFKSNKVGTEVLPGWGLPEQSQAVICSNTRGEKPGAMHLRSTMGELTPGINAGYYKLTDDIDVRVVYGLIPGFTPAGNTAPFLLVNNTGGATIETGTYFNNLMRLSLPTYGGWLYYKLRRNVTGGSIRIPAGIIISSIFLAYGDTEGAVFSAQPYLKLQTADTTLTFPSKCTINAGADLNIDFGSVNSDLLSTSASVSDRNYKAINPSFVCTGSVVDARSLAVRLTAASSTLSNTLIASTIGADLGIAMMSADKVVKPGDLFQVSSTSGRGAISVGFVPVKRSGKNVSGSFTATATLVIVFP